jgi:hypothetical protein
MKIITVRPRPEASPRRGILDRVYDRLDLWSSTPGVDGARESDYAKVRGCIFYLFVLLLLAWEMWTLSSAHEFPIGQITLQIVALLAYTMGERTFIAFLHAWSERGGTVDTETIELYRSPDRDPTLGIDPTHG